MFIFGISTLQYVQIQYNRQQLKREEECLWEGGRRFAK